MSLAQFANVTKTINYLKKKGIKAIHLNLSDPALQQCYLTELRNCGITAYINHKPRRK